MKKFNWIDAVIIILVIALCAGGYWYLNRHGKIASKQTTKIEFTIAVSRVPIEVANAYHVGDKVTFGTKNVDTGVISNVVIIPFTQDIANPTTGELQKAKIEGFYDAYVTIQTQGTETDKLIQSSQETLNVGVEMIFHGKGFSGKGFITQLQALKGGE